MSTARVQLESDSETAEGPGVLEDLLHGLIAKEQELPRLQTCSANIRPDEGKEEACGCGTGTLTVGLLWS